MGPNPAVCLGLTICETQLEAAPLGALVVPASVGTVQQPNAGVDILWRYFSVAAGCQACELSKFGFIGLLILYTLSMQRWEPAS